MGSIIDLVVSGPDFSGTTTQIGQIIDYLQKRNLRVKDIRGTEIDALFHADIFSPFNDNYLRLGDFMSTKSCSISVKGAILANIYKLLSGEGYPSDLRVASMVNNPMMTYINPRRADVWVLEEPTRRGAGQVNRVIEQNRSYLHLAKDPVAEALAHQAYRIDEFARFRKPMRDAGNIVLRSRSEESACYQLHDATSLPSGISVEEYLRLPGHNIAFSHPPSHIFVVCGPESWEKEKYEKFRASRVGNRILDDNERDTTRQLLVNRRYASSWLEDLYEKGCTYYGTKTPQIIRFNILDSREEIQKQMYNSLDSIIQ